MLKGEDYLFPMQKTPDEDENSVSFPKSYL